MIPLTPLNLFNAWDEDCHFFRDVRFESKLGQIGAKWEKSGFSFQWPEQFSYIRTTLFFVLMYCGIYYKSAMLLCDAHIVLEPHRETADLFLFYSLSSFPLFLFVCLSLWPSFFAGLLYNLEIKQNLMISYLELFQISFSTFNFF